ncbi:MAG: AAA family ATPase [Desulfobulbaceae bacterium]|nr:AAA family ATPase [Desulfobulbaceae bacterium]
MSDNWENEQEQWDEGGKKYNMAHRGKKGGETFVAPETMAEIKLLEATDWKERGLRKETLETFGVKCLKSQEFGPVGQIEKVFFPYYNQGGKITGYKVKDLTKEKSEKFHFYTVGHVGVDSQLFGQNRARKNAKYLIITEGEVDHLSSYQAILDNTEEQYKKFPPAVVSIGCGTVSAVDHLGHNTKFLGNFPQYRVCFDNDELTQQEKLKKNPGMKGKEATQAVGAFLIESNKKVFVPDWYDWVNDCSDFLQSGKDSLLSKQLLWDVSEFSAEKVLKGSDIEMETLLKPKEKGVYVDSFPLLMDKLWGIRKSELSILTAMSGVGKTVVSSEIAYKLAEETGEKVALVFLEETSEETLMRMIARRLQVNYYKFVFDPLSFCSREDFAVAYGWCKDKFFFLDVFGSMRVTELMNTFKSLYYASGCGYIVFDHLSMMASGSQVNDERRLIDQMMTELAAFMAQTDVGCLAVSHLSRQAQTEIGKLSDLTEPKWINVRKEHLRGSAALEQLSWNIFGLDMLLTPDRERADVRLTVLKNRTIGKLGVCDQFKMDEKTGLIIPSHTGYGD